MTFASISPSYMVYLLMLHVSKAVSLLIKIRLKQNLMSIYRWHFRVQRLLANIQRKLVRALVIKTFDSWAFNSRLRVFKIVINLQAICQ